MEDEVLLNKVAQGSISVDDAIAWFLASPREQRRRLQLLVYMALQAGARASDLSPAMERFGLAITYTPCVVAGKEPFRQSLSKVALLEGIEALRSFQLLLGIFCIADERRRSTVCAKGCSHWWHNLPSSANQTVRGQPPVPPSSQQ
jgi:hypothetical protein